MSGVCCSSQLTTVLLRTWNILIRLLQTKLDTSWRLNPSHPAFVQPAAWRCVHAYKHDTHITECTNPLAKHFYRLSLSITLQLYGWIWIVTSVFNISPLPSSRFYKTCLFSRKYLTKFVGQDDRHTAVRICSREVLRVILPAVSAKHKKKTQWKNIKVEAQLRSLCPLNELLTHAQSLCISLLSSFLRLERHWCVICCWKRVSSNHHLSISLKLYLLPQAYRPANDISRINFPLNLLSFQIRHTSSTVCCRLLLTKEIVSHTSSTYFFGTLRSR